MIKKVLAIILVFNLIFLSFAVIFADAANISSNNQLSLEEFLSKREYTEEQLKAMHSYTPEELQKAISTPGDAIAFLNIMFPKLWHSYHIWTSGEQTNGSLRSGKQVLLGVGPEQHVAGRSDMSTTVAYLLNDDYSTGAFYGFYYSDTYFKPITSSCYIQYNSKYYIFDPANYMSASVNTQLPIIFKPMVSSSIDEFVYYIESDKNLSSTLSSLYQVPNGEEILFTSYIEWTNITYPKSELLYSNPNKQVITTVEEYKKLKDNHINPENIHDYKLPTILGGLTLSIDEAKYLVGQSPEMIKEKVKTAGDVLLYMLASKTKLENGDQQLSLGGYYWHYNRSAKEVLDMKLANCGSSANLANYLLEGDYEEIGFILHSYAPGNGGGHVYNYIKYQSKYYIVDFSSYLFSDYSVNDEFNFINMADLKEYETRSRDCYGSGLTTIIAHKSPGMHLPNVWDDRTLTCYYPEGSEFLLIKETPNGGYKVGTKPMSKQLANWNVKPVYISEVNEAESAANYLFSLGLFQGKGKDKGGKPIYALNDKPTRQEAMVMLVRLLGKENEAIKNKYNIPFLDVEDWAMPYVGYAYTHGLTLGVDVNRFGSKDFITYNQYITFVLRALGYSSKTDFTWDEAWKLSNKLGITNLDTDSSQAILRGDVAIISQKALSTNIKNKNYVLYDFIFNKIEEDTNDEKSHIIAENIDKYKLSTMLGGLTLSIEDAKKLVDASPETVKEKVNTAGDMLLYMLAVNMGLSSGDQWINIDGNIWHYNRTAKEVIAMKEADCGSSANLANYLLEGDYEEIGFILHSYAPGQGGGHVYNYIKYQGKYYIVDFSSYLFNDYNVNSEFNFISMNSLMDYKTRSKECYGDLSTIIAHTSKGTHLPNVWDDNTNTCYYPDDAEFILIKETPNGGYSVKTMPMPRQVQDWK